MIKRNLDIVTIFFLLAVFIPSILFSQDATINATVDRNQVGLNERFIYTVEVSGNSTSLPEPKFPSMAEFSVLSGPNTSTNIQFINGAMSSSHRYSFYLMSQNEGEFTIDPATIDNKGEILSSNTIKMVVTKATANPEQKEPKVSSKNDQDLLGENLYLKSSVNKKSVYQNEQILVEYKLYFRVNVRTYNIEKIPPNSGFWMEEFKTASQPTVSREIINGITYQVATLRKVALFPTRSGELTIEPMVISVDALTKEKKRSRSLFDNFFDDPFGRTVKKILNSNPINITVKALPAKDRPSDFDGVVGNYQISAKADLKELKSNEAVSVKLTITGEGNLKLVKPPELKLPPDMEVYAPREKTDISARDNKITGIKTVEYVIVPRLKGEYKIEPVSLSYFDPRRGKYLKTSTKPIHLNVLPGDETGAGLMAGSSLSKQEVALLGQDIRYIKESAEFYLRGQNLYANWLYLIIYLIPVIGLVIAWRFNMHRTKMRGNIQLARRRKAGKIASKHLTLAKSLLKSRDKEAFYRATTDALQGFVCDRMNVQISDFSSVQVENDLEKAGLGKDDIKEYLSCLQESDFSRYSGSQAEVGEMESFYQRVKKNLTQLEKYI